MTTSEIIRNTIVNAVAENQNVSVEMVENSYGKGLIEAVTEALTERVYVVTELIVTEAGYNGLNEEEAKRILGGLGLDSRPEPEPVVEEEVPAAPLTTDEKVEQLLATVSDLAGTVGKLVTLAETKLGATL